jgi:hypothetical protein
VPTEKERVEIVTDILRDVLDPGEVPQLVAHLPDAPIAFFSDIRVELIAAKSVGEVSRRVNDLKALANSVRVRESVVAAVTSATRLPLAELTELAMQIWHDRSVATQSYVGN